MELLNEENKNISVREADVISELKKVIQAYDPEGPETGTVSPITEKKPVYFVPYRQSLPMGLN
jgi:hypothetical protein